MRHYFVRFRIVYMKNLVLFDVYMCCLRKCCFLFGEVKALHNPFVSLKRDPCFDANYLKNSLMLRYFSASYQMLKGCLEVRYVFVSGMDCWMTRMNGAMESIWLRFVPKESLVAGMVKFLRKSFFF